MLSEAERLAGSNNRAIMGAGTPCFWRRSRTPLSLICSKTQRVTALGFATAASRASGASR